MPNNQLVMKQEIHLKKEYLRQRFYQKSSRKNKQKMMREYYNVHELKMWKFADTAIMEYIKLKEIKKIDRNKANE